MNINTRTILHCALAVLLFAGIDVHAVTFTWVTVVDTGNPNDPGNLSAPNAYGAVADSYRIATHEVTNLQYVEFLNAVAATDTNGLYSTFMTSSVNYGGITRNGVSGSFSYSAKPNFENKPVTYVSWNDAARFANWMHNGQSAGAQGAGTTENGAYDMTVPTPVRLAVASHFLPSENEWYKGAFYAPGSAAANGDDYWQYPTQSDTLPTAEPPPGGANSANIFGQSGGVLTDVGAYTGSMSHYGAFDMVGNVTEWNEGLVGANRVLRGEGWGVNFTGGPQSSDRSILPPTDEHEVLGFRIASIPEPATGSLILIALAALVYWRRRV